LASIYADCPDGTLRNPGQAVSNALLISNLNLKRQRLLGVARYRAGDVEEAVDALRMAVEQPIADAFDSFYLAMSYWQLNDPGMAVLWYQHGCANVNKPSLTEIDCIQAARAEAAGLILSPRPVTSQR
jgi:hypothetical protein